MTCCTNGEINVTLLLLYLKLVTLLITGKMRKLFLIRVLQDFRNE